MRSMYSESIRLDIRWFRDGRYEFRFMRPDQRKRSRKDYAKCRKWEWAIASGFGSTFYFKQDAMTHVKYADGIPAWIGALAGHTAYVKRAIDHDRNLAPGERPWIKKGRPL